VGGLSGGCRQQPTARKLEFSHRALTLMDWPVRPVSVVLARSTYRGGTLSRFSTSALWVSASCGRNQASSLQLRPIDAIPGLPFSSVTEP
jgi:hypothetical protein